MTAPSSSGTRGGEVAQKACLLEGLTQLFAVTPGDFAVILHSDPDCANLVFRDFRAVDPTRFFCTNLEERDVLGGTSAAVLEQAIREVAAESSPEAIFVIGSCVSSMLADDIRGITEGLASDVGPRLVPVHTDAFRLYGQAHILDMWTSMMWRMSAGEATRVARSVNLLGFAPDGGETETLLGRMGVTVTSAPGVGDGPDSWAALASGALNVTTDSRLFSTLMQDMLASAGTPMVEVPPPFGLGATRDLYEAVARGLGLDGASLSVVDDASREPASMMESFLREHGGARLGYHLAGRKDFSLQVVVREGLSAVRMFSELGFDVHLLLQGSTEGRSGERVRSMLERYGLDLPLHGVRDRVSVTGAIETLGLDVIYCSDSLREEVGRARIPLVPIGSMRPGFSGLVGNMELLADASRRSRSRS